MKHLLSIPSRSPRTAPPIQRASMRARPWFGLARGLLMALLPGMRFFWPLQHEPGWLIAAERRRRALLLVVALVAVAAAASMLAMAPADPSPAWWVYAGLGVLLLAWVGAGLATALMGARVLLRGDRHALALDDPHAPIDAAARTAVIMPICNEDIATVFAGLRATCESAAATGALRLFDFYILSDTSDPVLRAAELRAWQRLRDMLGDGDVAGIGQGARIFYRWRRVRRHRKAGNVADFCRRWGSQYRYMVVLDADSTMHGDTLVSLVRLMEQHPNAGIVQTLPQAYGHGTLHARLQQFAGRVTGRLFALGMAYWQLGESHYWGHNAILRVEPFMRHCALAPVRGRGALSGTILSHDFVEAAMMRRAGYEVWLAPQLEGSWEQQPPNLIDELQRDRRWCRGNLQHLQLIAEPGWRPVHRVMFAVGSFSYAMAPLWLLFVALGVAAGTQDPGSAHAWAGHALWSLTLALLLLPRVLGVLSVRLRGEQAAYGGSLRLVTSALLEAVVTALQAPVRMLAHTAFVLGPLTGLRLDWKSPPRDAARVAWRDAAARVGLPAALALGLVALAWPHGDLASPHLVALTLSLLLAVPLAVWAGHPRVGAVLRRLRLLLVPQEARPPRPLARAVEQLGFRDLVPPPAPARVRGPATPLWPRATAALAGGVLSLAVALAPQSAATPELPAGLRAQLDALASQPTLEPRLLRVADAAPSKRTRTVRERPARMIDNAVRERARDAVRRAIELEFDEPA
ncbi:MAG TPA: glucans biosynthesis glucosyltransferase MdoH [Burkholderiaceae bacterium]|nr:glucans biosynthesis glucosyltransferase MdoH [Burkholderiaceae bacterium]